MELAEIFQRTHFYTRTKAEKVDKLHAALGVSGEGAEAGHVENSKLALAVDSLGEWRLRFSTPATTQETQFSLSGDSGPSVSTVHSVAGVQFRGHVTSHGDILTFQGSLAAEAEDQEAVSASPQLIVSWQLGTEPGRVVQTSTVMWTTGLTGIFVDCKETYELDIDLMYRTEYRSKIRPYIDTKLPSLLLKLPYRVPAPASWCLCHDAEDGEDNAEAGAEADPRCAVHGTCDECEVSNSVCDCDWWYDQHFCTSCGLNLINCDCAHISEIMEKLYDF